MSQSALARLVEKFPDAIVSTHSHRGDETALLHAPRLLEVATFCKSDPEMHFDMLVDLTCLDTLGLNLPVTRVIGGVPESGRFQVVYHLRSMKTGQRLRLKAAVDESESGDSPEIDSVTSLWKSANWAEREVWDMFGIKFRGHPDLRRILMYEEFEGHPLRKDYPTNLTQPLVAYREGTFDKLGPFLADEGMPLNRSPSGDRN